MRNQSAMTARIVPKGIAPDEPALMRKRSSRKMMAKMILPKGKERSVRDGPRPLNERGRRGEKKKSHVGKRVDDRNASCLMASPLNDV